MNVNTKNMEKIVGDARELAMKSRHSLTTADHLLRVLLDDQTVIDFLTHAGVDHDEIRNDLDEVLDDEDVHSRARNAVNPVFTSAVTEMMQMAVVQASNTSKKEVTSLHLLNAFVSIPADRAEAHSFVIMRASNVTSTKINEFQMDTGLDGVTSEGIKDPEEAKAFLKKYCKNLNDEAKAARIDPLIGRESEVADIVLKTARRTKNNVIVIGEPGVGKTAVVEGLAKLIVEGKVPKTIENSTIYSLSVTDLIAGTKYRGEAEERVRDLISALTQVPNPILFIDEIHMVMGAGAGSSGSMDMANMLKPALARGRLRCIGATTHDEFQKHIEQDRALMRRFQLLQVEEPSLDDCKRILAGIAGLYSEYHGVNYSDEAIEAAVDLSDRYVQNRHLPDKAIDVLDAAGARQRIRGDQKDLEITVQHIRTEISEISKIPVSEVTTDDLSKLRVLSKNIKSQLFGQDEAVDALVDCVLVAKTGLRSRKKTLGAFLMTGPSGVGKTELAKQLADTLQMKMTRFDMSEYREGHTISKLIGSPPGYVGFAGGGAGSGLLTSAVEKYPFSIVLFDEIEKAHPDVFNLFLQIMDEGHLTNSGGKKISFENTIILMTSNAGAREAASRSVGFTKTEFKEGADEAVIQRIFTPEFRNRLDANLKFKSLTRDNMLLIVDKFLQETTQQVADSGNVLVVTQQAREKLAEKGYDPTMGARPLARMITKEVKTRVSRELVFGNHQKPTMLLVDIDSEGNFILKTSHVPAKEDETKQTA